MTNRLGRRRRQKRHKREAKQVPIFIDDRRGLRYYLAKWTVAVHDRDEIVDVFAEDLKPTP